MQDEPRQPPALSTPSEDEIRHYAYYLYERSGFLPGHDLDNWMEAIACLQANIPPDQSGTRLQPHINAPERGELAAISLAARTLMC